MWLPLTTITPDRYLARQRQLWKSFYNVGAGHVSLTKEAGSSRSTYSLAGRLVGSRSGWVLLEVPSALARGAFDALHEPGAELPPDPSAHIRVMGPDELEQIGGIDRITERGHFFRYQLGPVQVVDPDDWPEMSKAWCIKVISPELEKLRKSYGLTAKPRNNSFDFHIVFAVRRKHVLKENDVTKTAADCDCCAECAAGRPCVAKRRVQGGLGDSKTDDDLQPTDPEAGSNQKLAAGGTRGHPVEDPPRCLSAADGKTTSPAPGNKEAALTDMGASFLHAGDSSLPCPSSAEEEHGKNVVRVVPVLLARYVQATMAGGDAADGGTGWTGSGGGRATAPCAMPRVLARLGARIRRMTLHVRTEHVGRIRLPVIGHYRPKRRVTRDAFVYMDPVGDADHFAECQTCRSWTGKSCVLFEKGNSVQPTGSCGLYQHGKGDPNRHGKEMGVVTREEAGYTDGPVRCENCAFFDDDESYCELFERLNEGWPDVFDLDRKVKARGCCNAQVPRGEKIEQEDGGKAASHSKIATVGLDGILAHHDGWKGKEHLVRRQPGVRKARPAMAVWEMPPLFSEPGANRPRVSDPGAVLADDIIRLAYSRRRQQTQRPARPAAPPPLGDRQQDDDSPDGEKQGAFSDYVFLPGNPGENIVNRIQRYHQHLGEWQASQLGAQADRPTYHRIFRGIANLLGVNPSDEFLQAATGDVARIAPYLQRLLPSAWEAIHGPVGSGARLGSELFAAGLHPLQAGEMAGLLKNSAQHGRRIITVNRHDGKVRICPHCNQEVKEKDIYRDAKGWLFHRPCFMNGKGGSIKMGSQLPDLIQRLFNAGGRPGLLFGHSVRPGAPRLPARTGPKVTRTDPELVSLFRRLFDQNPAPVRKSVSQWLADPVQGKIARATESGGRTSVQTALSSRQGLCDGQAPRMVCRQLTGGGAVHAWQSFHGLARSGEWSSSSGWREASEKKAAPVSSETLHVPLPPEMRQLLGIGVPSLVGLVVGGLASGHAVRKTFESVKKDRKVTPQQIRQIYRHGGLPEDLPTYQSPWGNAVYIPNYSFAPDMVEAMPGMKGKIKGTSDEAKIRQYGAMVYDPDLMTPAIAAHETGHARLDVGRPWYSPSKFNQRYLRPVGSILNRLAPLVGAYTGYRTGRPLLSAGVGLGYGGITMAPELISEFQASHHANRYLNEVAQDAAERGKEALRRAYASYAARNLLPGPVAGLLAALARKPLMKHAGFRVAPSPIHGNGVFADTDMSVGDDLGLALVRIDHAQEGQPAFRRTMLGRYLNHTDDPNAELYSVGDGMIRCRAIKPIARGDEVTIEYGHGMQVQRDVWNEHLSKSAHATGGGDAGPAGRSATVPGRPMDGSGATPAGSGNQPVVPPDEQKLREAEMAPDETMFDLSAIRK